MNDKNVTLNHNENTQGESVGLPNWLKISLLILTLTTIGILVIYRLQFSGTWGNQEIFAQFGDFVGGTINPILGFATIGLLVWSINIQLKELQATRAEARDSRLALENQLIIAKNESHLKQIQMAIDTYISERELVLSKKLPLDCLRLVFKLLIDKHGFSESQASKLLDVISTFTYKNCIIPFNKVHLADEMLISLSREELDGLIESYLVENTEARGVILSSLFMTLQISKSLFDYHHITTYKKHPTVLLWKHQTSYLEPYKNLIESHGIHILFPKSIGANTPKFHEELEEQIEKVNNLSLDF